MSKNYLETYLEKDDLAMYIYQKEIGDVMLLKKLASMTDEELGKWFADKERSKDDLTDAAIFVGEKRLSSALSYVSEEDLADILNNISLDLLIAYDEVDKGSFDYMPKEFEELNYFGLAMRLKKLYSRQEYDIVATTIVVLYRRGILLELLEEELLTYEDVAKLVVGFYTNIFGD